MLIRESAEMYLETILVLTQRRGQVRAIDIAGEMGYSKPSVSNKMKKFRENGYILVDADGGITLTQKGREIAERTYERHEVLARLLMSIGVGEELAYQDACKLEHAVSDETFEHLKRVYYTDMKDKTGI